ncbi:hypothetical protein [Shewanella pealeana]|uniref:Uncharacterized protein n=1 Tax=Shewanella pealeana (strain ATCC 700345 / ANG-SQ1) TaxID=398579 RepID=A8H4P3_SHEPA|nr:hypothetical protein [Shewanella pealeana]ABV87530.1 hypothetical protein Spea_2210 [Shewanella pealeana ATCC 700345]
MTNEELFSDIKKLASESISAHIRITSEDAFRLILNLIVNKSCTSLQALVVNNSSHKNYLFESFNDSVFVRNVIDFLEDGETSFNILTNEPRKLKKSLLFRDAKSSNLKIKNISDSAYNRILNNKYQYSYLVGDSKSYIIGEFEDFENDEQPKVANFLEEGFCNKLNDFYKIIEKVDVSYTGGAK